VFLDKKNKETFEVVAISTFKIMLDHSNEYDIFFHALMTKNTFDKLQEDRK
jgi:hypothetical protein